MAKNDIFFISYGEFNAERNWETLALRFPYAKRIDNIKGIHNAYRLAAEYSRTEYFFIVDADNVILDDFEFDFEPIGNSFGTYIWQAQNPVNYLVYGYGGIKMYNKAKFLIADYKEHSTNNAYKFMDFYDFPVVSEINFIGKIASITHFNSSPFDAWKAAFRECCKLVSFGEGLELSGAQRQESNDRLRIWCTVGNNEPFGNWVLVGAKDGQDFGIANYDHISELAQINDYSWLKNFFIKKYNYVFS